MPARGLPSMTALLGLLAWQVIRTGTSRRMLKGAGSNNAQPGASTRRGPLGGLLGSLSGAAAFGRVAAY